MKISWLLCDNDFNRDDSNFDYFPEVGIISKSYCDDIFLFSRMDEKERMDCPKCGNVFKNNKLKTRPRYKCSSCRHIFSSKAGTYLDNSKLPTYYWYRLAWLITNLNFPINSSALSKSLGLTQKTVYYMLITIRDACNLKCKGSVKGINFNVSSDLNWYSIVDSLTNLKQ